MQPINTFLVTKNANFYGKWMRVSFFFPQTLVFEFHYILTLVTSHCQLLMEEQTKHECTYFLTLSLRHSNTIYFLCHC